MHILFIIAPVVALTLGLALVCWLTRQPNPLNDGWDDGSHGDCATAAIDFHSSKLAQGAQHDHA